MKLASFLTWQNWALLGLNLAVESLILFLSIKRDFYKRLFMLTVLAGYCALIDVAFIVLALVVNVDSFSGKMYYSRLSWNFYWVSQVAASLLILLLSIQIAIETLKLKYVVALWGNDRSYIVNPGYCHLDSRRCAKQHAYAGVDWGRSCSLSPAYYWSRAKHQMAPGFSASGNRNSTLCIAPCRVLCWKRLLAQTHATF